MAAVGRQARRPQVAVPSAAVVSLAASSGCEESPVQHQVLCIRAGHEELLRSCWLVQYRLDLGELLDAGAKTLLALGARMPAAIRYVSTLKSLRRI